MIIERTETPSFHKQPDYLLTTGLTAVRFASTFIPHYLKGRYNAIFRPVKDDTSPQAYKEYLDSSLHYALELHMYDQMVRDMTSASMENEDKDKLKDPSSPQCRLLDAHLNFFYSWFSQDDLDDRSVFRGSLISYHETHSPQAATQIYDTCQADYIEAARPFGIRATGRIENLLADLDRHLKADSHKEYYQIDPEGKHDPFYMFNCLNQKSGNMIDVSSAAVEAISGRELNPEWYYGLSTATEGMWLANDLKDLTQPGIRKWAELKSGRINLPLAIMLRRSEEHGRELGISPQQLIDITWKVWETYKPCFTDFSLPLDKKLQAIADLDQDPIMSNNLGQLNNLMFKTGTIEIVQDEIKKRTDALRQVIQLYPNHYFLRLYDLAVSYYTTEKFIRIAALKLQQQ